MALYKVVAGLALCVFASGVLAAGEERVGFAVSGGLGASMVRDEDSTDTFEGNDLAFTLGAEFRIAPTVGLSVGVFNLGAPTDIIDDVKTKIDVAGLDMLARLYAPVAERVELFGLAGGAVYLADVEPGGNNGFGDGAWALGGGMDIDSGPNSSVRIEGRFLNGPRDESAGLLTIGFNYRF